MPGRKPMGPKLVQHLEGSPDAKQRLEVILETIAGRLAIKDACEQLGIGEAMFHKLRTRVLAACVDELEPKPRGRPRRAVAPQAEQVEQLEQELDQLRDELLATDIRLELAAVLPQVLDNNVEKKTIRSTRLNQAWRARQRRLNRRPKYVR